jgi:hypothetical protein
MNTSFKNVKKDVYRTKRITLWIFVNYKFLIFTIKSCICLLYYMSLTVNFFVYARFNVVSANRW